MSDSLSLALQQKSDPVEVWSFLKRPDHMAIDWSGLVSIVVAVGTEISLRPPRRSRRALLTTLNGRSDPSGLGIYVRLTGLAR